LDIDGNVIYSNRHGSEITGYSPDEIEKGINIFRLFDSEDHERIRKNISRILMSKTIKQSEYTMYKNDGSKIPILLYTSVIISNKKPVGLRGVLVDMTERKRTEEIMIQTEKMMSLGGLAAGMAHEINNPLAGIVQNSQVIHHRLTKNLPANQRVVEELGISMKSVHTFMEKRDILILLDNIQQAGNHAAKIIQNMLSFARKGESGRSTHRMDELIDNTLELAKNDYNLKKKYDFKKIKIVREFSPDMPPVSCEKTKIQQVLFNIFKNAAQAMNVEDQANNNSRLILRLSIEENGILIEIEDNGPGMDEETRKEIFEPFFTTKGPGKGTGLGLSVSYFIIVKEHGGEMTVDSTPGKGSRFIIKLPME